MAGSMRTFGTDGRTDGQTSEVEDDYFSLNKYMRDESEI